MNTSVLVSIVTYNPDINVIKDTVQKCMQNNITVYIFDNNSNNYGKLKEITYMYNNVVVDTKNKNMGIAYALNAIFSFGKKELYDWVITLDQDSKITDEFLMKYSVSINKFENNNEVAIICPKIIDENVNKIIFGGEDEYEELKDPEDLITSGSCIKVLAWDKVGGFYNELFIDFVDTDFQQKILLNSYKIIRCNRITLFHKVGNAKDIKIGKWIIHCSNHNSFRRYYMVRNRLYFYRKYYGIFAYYKSLIRLIMGTFKIILFEDEKIAKIRAFLKGMKDYKELL